MSFFGPRIPLRLLLSVAMCAWMLFGCASFSDFLIFDDVESLEEYRLGSL